MMLAPGERARNLKCEVVLLSFFTSLRLHSTDRNDFVYMKVDTNTTGMFII